MKISSLQKIRYGYVPRLPNVFTEAFGRIKVEKITEKTGNTAVIKNFFPCTFDNPFIRFTIGGAVEQSDIPSKPLRVAAVLSGGQAPGGHNVIAGLYDALQKLHTESQLFGFLDGPQGLVSSRYCEITADTVAAYRNTGGFDMIGSGRTKIETDAQMTAAAETVQMLKLDAVVIIGGDDSNTNAAVLSEYFAQKHIKTAVIGVPKTIDGDLKSEKIETSFGFDTASKVYANLIGNIQRDAVSAKKYWHFIKLMGRHASHITLECALQTQPNIALIGEEIAAQKCTLAEIITSITDTIVKRAAKGEQFGVVLIPEGIIEFIPEMKPFIHELNTALAKDAESFNTLQTFAEQAAWVEKSLSSESAALFKAMPEKVASGFLRDRDEHGNLVVSMVKTEELIIGLVEERLAKMKKLGTYTGTFATQSYFFGYEGRAEFPSNFDSDYCYALGYTACLLAACKQTGCIASVCNVTAPAAEWQPCGVPITGLMTIEMRAGKEKPVIKKSVVDLQGVPFKTFVSKRDLWAESVCYTYPGPIQYAGDPALTDCITATLALEHGKEF
ncbi:MAG: diphosphate--fructose-6-phosphate 1-phosphotransferase [Treponema sp.]